MFLRRLCRLITAVVTFRYEIAGLGSRPLKTFLIKHLYRCIRVFSLSKIRNVILHGATKCITDCHPLFYRWYIIMIVNDVYYVFFTIWLTKKVGRIPIGQKGYRGHLENCFRFFQFPWKNLKLFFFSRISIPYYISDVFLIFSQTVIYAGMMIKIDFTFYLGGRTVTT